MDSDTLLIVFKQLFTHTEYVFPIVLFLIFIFVELFIIWQQKQGNVSNSYVFTISYFLVFLVPMHLFLDRDSEQMLEHFTSFEIAKITMITYGVLYVIVLTLAIIGGKKAKKLKGKNKGMFITDIPSPVSKGDMIKKIDRNDGKNTYYLK